MWETRVVKKSFGRSVLQVCKITEDQQFDWLDVDETVLKTLVAHLNGMVLKAEDLEIKVGQLTAANTALRMPRGVKAPLGANGPGRPLSIVTSREDSRKMLTPAMLQDLGIEPMEPDAPILREGAIISEEPVREDNVLYKGPKVVNQSEPLQSLQSFGVVRHGVTLYEITPPFPGFPFSAAV